MVTEKLERGGDSMWQNVIENGSVKSGKKPQV